MSLISRTSNLITCLFLYKLFLYKMSDTAWVILHCFYIVSSEAISGFVHDLLSYCAIPQTWQFNHKSEFTKCVRIYIGLAQLMKASYQCEVDLLNIFDSKLQHSSKPSIFALFSIIELNGKYTISSFVSCLNVTDYMYMQNVRVVICTHYRILMPANTTQYLTKRKCSNLFTDISYPPFNLRWLILHSPTRSNTHTHYWYHLWDK